MVVVVSEATVAAVVATSSFDELDVLVLDTFEDPGLMALRIAEARRIRANLLILVLGVDEFEPPVVDYLQAGAAGYVDQASTADDLLRTIRSVVRGEMPCSPLVAARLSARLRAFGPQSRARPADSRGCSAQLTDRETEILDCLDNGLSNKQIALRLQLALPTVKNHVHSLLEKLEASSRGEAVAVFRRHRAMPLWQTTAAPEIGRVVAVSSKNPPLS